MAIWTRDIPALVFMLLKESKNGFSEEKKKKKNKKSVETWEICSQLMNR